MNYVFSALLDKLTLKDLITIDISEPKMAEAI